MSEWHITPDYIVNNWTDELLDLMVQKFVERRNRETSSIKPPSNRFVSVEALSAISNGMIKVEHGN